MMGTDPPLVSVLMPYYNGRAFMREAVASVLNQTYRPIEIVIVDDASPHPEDAQYIEGLTRELGLQLIKHTTNLGPSRTMARGFAASRGTLIGELSQDDLYLPDKIQRQVEALRGHNWDAVYAAGDVMYQASGRVEIRRLERTRTIIESGRALEHLQQQNLPGISLQGLLAKRTVFERDIVPIWHNYMLDDWPVHIRLFERYNVGFLEGPLWRSRAHRDNSSWQIWRLLGPQVEVVARMTPVQHRTEAIGNRLTSLARRLHKQGGDAHAITRLALAGLMMVNSREQCTKARRILHRIPARTRQAITRPKLKQLQQICCVVPEGEGDRLNASERIDWQALGRTITQGVSTAEGDERLFSIGRAFSALALGLLETHSFDPGTRAALCALMLLGDIPDETRLINILRAVQWEHKHGMMAQKAHVLKTCSRLCFRSLFG